MRLISGLLYGAAGTVIILMVAVFILRIIGRHGGAAGAAVESHVANLSGLNV